MRRPVQVAPFDSPPGWMGPKELRRFHAELDPPACDDYYGPLTGNDAS